MFDPMFVDNKSHKMYYLKVTYNRNNHRYGGKIMFCINCGEPLAEGSKFCPKCGTQQLNNQNMAPQQNPFAPVQPANPFEAQPAAPVQPEAAANPFEAQPAVPVQPAAEPANPFEAQPAAPVQPEAAANPFEAQPAAPVQPEAAANPFAQAAPQQETPNPFEPQGAFQPQDSFQPQGSFEPQQNGNQWGPMMQPEKKNKKPLIIGIVVALIAVIAVVAVVLVIVFSNSKDNKDDKATKKTTKSVAEMTTPQDETKDKEDKYTDSEIENEAKTLIDQYMNAVIDKSSDDIKKLYLDSVYEKMMDEYKEYNYTDDEMYEDLQLVPDTFGTVEKFTINEVKCQYFSEADDSFAERSGVKDTDDVIGYYCLEGTMTVESSERTGTFEFSCYVIQTKDSLTLYDLYGYGSSFANYDYKFNGKGEDKFGDWYIPDNGEKETTTDDSTTGGSVTDQEELIQSVIDKMDYNGTGASSEKNIAEKGMKALLSKNYTQSKKYIMPLIVAMYDVFVDEGYFTEEEVEESVFEDVDIRESVEMVSISIDDTQVVDESEVEAAFEDLSMFGDAVSVDQAKTLDTTVKYKNSDNDVKTVGCQMMIVKMSGNWYIADVAFDEIVE
jgi:hypothetical protein